MNPEPDLGSLKQQWQAQAAPVAQAQLLRERVQRDSQAHLRTVVLVAVVTLLVLAVTFAYAWRSARAAAWFSFFFTAAFATTVWLVALLLSRGTWRPQDESTAAYLDVSIRRCQSVIIAAPVGIVMYVLGLAGSLLWTQQELDTPGMILAGWIGAPLYSVCMLWNARRHRQRLAVLNDLKRQLRTG